MTDRTTRLKKAAEVELCEAGHYFLKLPDHPLRGGHARCPYCLSVGRDRLLSQNNLLEEEAEILKSEVDDLKSKLQALSSKTA